MENISKKIGFKMANELGVEKEQGEVFAYGIFALMQIIISLVLVALIGSFFSMALEAVIISVVSSILRKYSGGAHASKPSTCILIGTLICISQTLIIKYLVFPKINFILLFVIIIITFFIAYYLIFKYAPVDTEAKRIRTDTKRKRMKNLSIKMLNIYLIVCLLLLIIVILFNSNYINMYILCVCVGVLWQVFTLSKMGHLLFSKL